MQLALVGIFGAVGVMSRYLIDGIFAQRFTIFFPISTFAINCVGSFLIGILYALSLERALISQDLVVALGVGLLGGFTTFSAFSIQSLQLMQNRQYGTAVIYFIGSPLLGVIFAFLGSYLGSTLRGST